MRSDIRLLMLGAMYENGGNTTHRFLDGHPQMLVYPFESQVGTALIKDHLSTMFPVKYRWPAFELDATPYQDYKAIIDEEGKVRARTPHVSKFRHMAFDLSDDERCETYQEYVGRTGRSRSSHVPGGSPRRRCRSRTVKPCSSPTSTLRSWCCTRARRRSNGLPSGAFDLSRR